jgi:hypothetical protein
MPERPQLAQSPDAMRPPQPDAIEVLLTLSPAEYAQMSEDLAEVRHRLGLPASTPNDDVIREALHRLAHAPERAKQEDREEIST